MKLERRSERVFKVLWSLSDAAGGRLRRLFGRHVGHRRRLDVREGRAVEGQQPRPSVLGRCASWGRSWRQMRSTASANGRHLRPVPLGDGVAASPASLRLASAVPRASCSETRGKPPEAGSRLTPPPPDDEALQPAPGARRLDVEVQAVAVAVAACRLGRRGCAKALNRAFRVGGLVSFARAGA